MTLEEYIQEQLSARKLKDTAANRKKLKNEWSKKYQGGPVGDWKTIFRLEFPQFANIVDGGAGEAEARVIFGSDLIDLFFDVAKNPDNYDLISTAGQRAWKNRLHSTKFYINTLPNQREWDLLPKIQQDDQVQSEAKQLRVNYGDLELTDLQLADLARFKLRNKASDVLTAYYAYSLSYKKPADTPPPAAKDLKIALAKFDYKPKDIDQQIQSALTGTAHAGKVYTPALLDVKAKNHAKFLYPHYAKQIDAGENLDEIFEPFRELAAKTLEINADTINRSDPKFKVALDAVDENGNGMSGTAWVRKLKTDSIYNYGSTAAAHNEVSKIIMGLEKGWGKVI